MIIKLYLDGGKKKSSSAYSGKLVKFRANLPPPPKNLDLLCLWFLSGMHNLCQKQWFTHTLSQASSTHVAMVISALVLHSSTLIHSPTLTHSSTLIHSSSRPLSSTHPLWFVHPLSSTRPLSFAHPVAHFHPLIHSHPFNHSHPLVHPGTAASSCASPRWSTWGPAGRRRWAGSGWRWSTPTPSPSGCASSCASESWVVLLHAASRMNNL